MSTTISTRTRSFICTSCRHFRLRHKRRKFSTETPTPQSKLTYNDITIIGGGPVGLSLLAALKSNPLTSHLNCTLIESQDLSKQRSWTLPADEYSNRASSLTPSNVEFMESMGVWRCLKLGRVQPYDEMSVWDAGNDAVLKFDWRGEAVRYNAPVRSVATMVENANLVAGLLTRIDEVDAEGSLMGGSRVEGISNGSDEAGGLNLSGWPIVRVRDGQTGETRDIAARLLVGADGLNSPVRTFAGIESKGWDYGRHGVVATLKLQPAPQDHKFDSLFDEAEASDGSESDANANIVPSNRATAFQRFLPSLGGPIAILPLPDNHASMVWSTTPQIANTLKAMSPSAFVATVNAALRLRQVDVKYILSLPTSTSTDSPTASTDQHESELQWRLKHTDPPSLQNIPVVLDVQQGSRASFPLRLRNATTYTYPRIALAGDAAHTIHPLAGQGLNLGLADAECLARTIVYATERGMDIGDLGALEGYARERYGRGLVMAGGVDALNSVYQWGSDEGWWGSLVGRVRGLGMGVVGVVPGLREGIMRRAE